MISPHVAAGWATPPGTTVVLRAARRGLARRVHEGAGHRPTASSKKCRAMVNGGVPCRQAPQHQRRLTLSTGLKPCSWGRKLTPPLRGLPTPPRHAPPCACGGHPCVFMRGSLPAARATAGNGTCRACPDHAAGHHRKAVSQTKCVFRTVANASGAPPPLESESPAADATAGGAYQFDLSGKKIAADDSRSDAIRQELSAEHRRLTFSAVGVRQAADRFALAPQAGSSAGGAA